MRPRNGSGFRPGMVCLVLFGLAFAPVACDRSSAFADTAAEHLAAGRFDHALESYERAYRRNPDNPEALAGLGLLLTMEPVSVFAGLDMLKASLELRPDDEVRRELLLAYVALDQPQRARAWIDPNRLSIEKLYSDEIQRFRTGLDCLVEPDWRKIRELEQKLEAEIEAAGEDAAPIAGDGADPAAIDESAALQAAHPRTLYFTALCSLQDARTQPARLADDRIARANEIYRALRVAAPEYACETLAAWPAGSPLRPPPSQPESGSVLDAVAGTEAGAGADGSEEAETGDADSDAALSPAEYLAAERIRCRRAFPGRVAFFRGRVSLPGLAEREAAARAGEPGPRSRILYETDRFTPPDPGADAAARDYRYGNYPRSYVVAGEKDGELQEDVE